MKDSKNNIGGYMFSFVENDELVTKFIPKELKKQFIKEFETKVKDVSSADIDAFIEKNKVKQ